jgi:hypothetical protein
MLQIIEDMAEIASNPAIWCMEKTKNMGFNY